MTTYLSKQKKGDLQELARQAGLSGYVSLPMHDGIRAPSSTVANRAAPL